MKDSMIEMGINQPAGVPLPRLVESFAGRRWIATGVIVENPVVNRLSGRSGGKTGYGHALDNRQVPRPIWGECSNRELSESAPQPKP